jgi:hypothetical protein
MRAVDEVHTQVGKHRSLLREHGITPNGPGVIGWSYEQLGSRMGEGVVVRE